MKEVVRPVSVTRTGKAKVGCHWVPVRLLGGGADGAGGGGGQAARGVPGHGGARVPVKSVSAVTRPEASCTRLAASLAPVAEGREPPVTASLPAWVA